MYLLAKLAGPHQNRHLGLLIYHTPLLEKIPDIRCTISLSFPTLVNVTAN